MIGIEVAGYSVPTYPLLTVAAVIAAMVLDLYVFRTRLVLTQRFWISLAIMVFFQIFIDGWLTRSTQTIVNYNQAEISGVRVFWNTPIEDFGFGFAMILLTLDTWRLLTERTKPT